MCSSDLRGHMLHLFAAQLGDLTHEFSEQTDELLSALDVLAPDCDTLLDQGGRHGTVQDSGLFLRCTDDGKAYQCLIDYHKGGTIGGVLGEGIWKRRGERNFTFGERPDVITINPHAQACPFTPDGWRALWKVGGWNEVRARIVGDPPVITTWVNGVQILSYHEPVSQHQIGRAHV